MAQRAGRETKRTQTNRKNKLLIKLGLCEECDNEQIEGSQYNYDLQKYVKAIDVTDEEYEAILKYADTGTNQSTTNNGEGGLRTVAGVVLALCIIGAIAQMIFGISCIGGLDEGIGIMMLLGAFVTIISGLVIYWTTKVFTNISEKTTEIRDILKSQSKK